MNFDFLQEAFKQLDEAQFEANDKEALLELERFREDSKLHQDTHIDIIDEDAEETEELADSYVGKAICECPICHSYIFKNKADIVIEENEELCNVDEECPYCCELGGFKIVGQVCDFSADEEAVEEETIEAENSEEEEEVTAEEEAPVEEGFNPKELDDDKFTADETNDEQILVEEDNVITPKNLDPDKFTVDTRNHEQTIVEDEDKDTVCKRILSGFDGTADDLVEMFNKCLGEDCWESISYDEENPDSLIEVFIGENLIGRYQMVENKLYNVDTNECLVEKCDSKEECEECKDCEESLKEDVSVNVVDDNGTEVVVADGEATMSNDAIEVKAADDSIVITAKEESTEETEPSAEEVEVVDAIEEPAEKEETSEEEVVAPISAEEVADAIADEEAKEEQSEEESEEATEEQAEEKSEEPAEETVKEVEADEAQVEEVSDEPSDEASEETVEEGFNPKELDDDKFTADETNDEQVLVEEVDVELTDIDNEAFDRLGTKYLTSIYENVESFMTTNVYADDSHIQLEGIINFKSGKSSNTKFVFESKDMSKDSNKARFVGMNESICKGKKAFVLTGSLVDGNYIAESLTYNYTTRTPSGRSVKINGTIKGE